MESTSKLILNIKKINDNNCLDKDVKINFQFSEVSQWCKEFLKLEENFIQTSISKEHLLERKEKLIKEILNY